MQVLDKVNEFMEVTQAEEKIGSNYEYIVSSLIKGYQKNGMPDELANEIFKLFQSCQDEIVGEVLAFQIAEMANNFTIQDIDELIRIHKNKALQKYSEFNERIRPEVEELTTAIMNNHLKKYQEENHVSN